MAPKISRPRNLRVAKRFGRLHDSHVPTKKGRTPSPVSRRCDVPEYKFWISLARGLGGDSNLILLLTKKRVICDTA
eukprot:1628964-Pyramimonas_sp.AAC.1